MYRTTIMLPDDLKLKLTKEAERENISFGELVRRALEKFLLSKKGIVAHDSFLASRTVFEDEGSVDVADRHDDYLFQKEPH